MERDYKRAFEAYGEGVMRIIMEPDDCSTIDDLAGDTYDPHCNPEIDRQTLADEYGEFIRRVNREGVWGAVLQVNTGTGFEGLDSIWGFIGNDFHGSGYDTDFYRTAVEYYESFNQGGKL